MVTPRQLGIVLGCILALAGLVPAPPAAALPDLVPEVYDLGVVVRDVLQADVDEGCAGGRYGRRLVSFSLRTHNVGPDDLVLGNPGCPNCSLNPGATCTNPLFECGESHGHAHFEHFAQNEILDADDNVVAIGLKYGFCLLDTTCSEPTYSCSYQGLSAGCSDVYSYGLPCQYVDITDAALPDGFYRIRVTIDPDGVFPEENEGNNVIEVPFEIGSTDQVCPVYESTDAPKALADEGVTTSTVDVAAVGEVTTVRLRMNGTHPRLGDLDAVLTSPSSTSRTLFSQVCGSADDFGLYLGDDAVGPLICPATDDTVLRLPEESFSVFDGEPAAGIWTLTIVDGAPGNTGELQSWELEVCTPCGNGVLEAGEACDDGNRAGGDCCSADCLVAASDGTSCEDANACTTSETCVSGACIPGGDVTCDPCLVCDAEAGCVVPDIVYPCQGAPSGRSALRLRRDGADPARDSLLWKWRSQTPVELDEFGAPHVSTDLSMCVYDGDSLVLSSTIPAAATCGDDPCWDVRESKASMSDRDGTFEGITSVKIREGAKGRITMKGRGAGLSLPPLGLDLPVTARLRRNDGTPCWEAVYEAAPGNTDTRFKARSR